LIFCPTTSAGQPGDAPQAGRLIEGLPAKVVMTDTAYDADHFRQAIADKGALAASPTTPRVPSSIRSTSTSTLSVASSDVASASSSSFDASLRASKKLPKTTLLS
jgi:hypothetical protein